jgi:ABC-type amino acid transport system permease subunit
MRPITPYRPSVYRRSSYGAWGVIGLVWAVLWRTVGVIGLVSATVIGALVGLGIVQISDVPRIIENLWTGSSGTGSGRI